MSKRFEKQNHILYSSLLITVLAAAIRHHVLCHVMIFANGQNERVQSRLGLVVELLKSNFISMGNMKHKVVKSDSVHTVYYITVWRLFQLHIFLTEKGHKNISAYVQAIN